jgi:hypothetical protein
VGGAAEPSADASGAAVPRAPDVTASFAQTALRDVRRIARFYRELQRAGGEAASPDPQSPTVGVTLGGLANLLCLRAEVDARVGDHAAAGAACRAAEILADHIDALPESSLRRRMADLRARLRR